MVEITSLIPNAALNEWPSIRTLTQQENHAVLDLTIDPSIHWFKGHFPDEPVLPGVVQVHWAAQLSQMLFKLSQPFTALENIKFQTMLLPAMAPTLELTYVADKRCVHFRYTQDSTIYSTGRIRFAIS